MVYDGTPMRMAHRLQLGLPFLLFAPSSCMTSGPPVLVVTSNAFGPVEGAQVKMALVDVAANKIVQTPPTATVTGGKFTFTLDVNAGTKYRVDLFTDDDSDGTCQFGIDSVYAVDVQDNQLSDGATYTANIDYNSNDPRGCLSFGGSTLHVTATNFTATGHIFKAALTRLDGLKHLAVFADVLQNGMIDFSWDGGIIAGNFYRVDIYIDNNNDDHCGGPDTFLSKTSGALPPGDTGDVTTLMIDGTR